MSKKTDTRKMRGEQLFLRLAHGPNFSGTPPSETMTPQQAQEQFRSWAESWVLSDLCSLIPELRDKLDALGYIKHDVVIAARRISSGRGADTPQT